MLVGLIRADGKLQTKQEVLAEATLFGQVDLYPLPVIARMFSEHGATGPSASQISGMALRRTVLERLIDFYAQPKSLIAMLRGTLLHAGMQHTQLPSGVQVITEKRLEARVPGTDAHISGQIDVYYPEYQRLEDYKTCQNVPSVIKEEHVFQLGIYYWLLVWNGYPVSRAVIDYISWDDIVQMSLAELPDDTIGNVITHPLLTKEDVFIDKLMVGWNILQEGFNEHWVPSMQYCKRQYCRYCPVKWACDQIDFGGEVINPEEFVQEGE